jgi:hypothetical protein
MRRLISKRVAANNKKTKETNRHKLRQYLSVQKCLDCGLGDLAVLEFDHRDPRSKRKEVSTLVSTRGRTHASPAARTIQLFLTSTMSATSTAMWDSSSQPVVEPKSLLKSKSAGCCAPIATGATAQGKRAVRGNSPIGSKRL